MNCGPMPCSKIETPLIVPAPADSSTNWVLAATILGSSIEFIDGTVVNVALLNLQSSLGATGSQAQSLCSGTNTATYAKHSKSFNLIDTLAVGVDRIQRNFEPMRKQVEAWQRCELTDVTVKVVIYEAPQSI